MIYTTNNKIFTLIGSAIRCWTVYFVQGCCASEAPKLSFISAESLDCLDLIMGAVIKLG